MGFRFLEHTADVQVECRAADFEGLLREAARALYALALQRVRTISHETRVLCAAGDSREDVLVRWLQELIYLLETEGFVATTFNFNQTNDLIVEAEVRGYRCESHERAEEVKSATYHSLEVLRTDDGFRARVIFDL